jgi:transposase-like protein
MDRRMVFSADDMTSIVERIEAAQGRGKSLEAACADWGISESTFFRWRLKHSDFQPRDDDRNVFSNISNVRM